MLKGLTRSPIALYAGSQRQENFTAGIDSRFFCGRASQRPCAICTSATGTERTLRYRVSNMFNWRSRSKRFDQVGMCPVWYARFVFVGM